MGRLCERPGCSDPASVAYGMRPEDLVFWLQVDSPDDPLVGGRLCRRHADSMIVPRGWTLDDRRDPDLHLFRPPAATPVAEAPSTGRRRRRSIGTEARLPLDGEEPIADADVASDPVTVPDGDADGEPAPAWMPSFDHDDDLDGLLAARSPLLARAFRGDDRPR